MVRTGDIEDLGQITKAQQPAFSAYMSGQQLNIAKDTPVTIIFNGEIFDIGGNFNTGTYTFTAPVTGKYVLTATVSMINFDATASNYSLIINTSNRNYGTVKDIGEFGSSPSRWYITATAVADMDLGDTAYISVRQDDGVGGTVDIDDGTITAPQSYFQGYLLG